MKYGIITDIHCNIDALNAALQKLDELKVDKIICCGDIVGIGLYPEETVQRLSSIKSKLIGVRGNHETYLLEGLPDLVHDRSMSENEINHHTWNHHQLSDASKVFLASLCYQTIIEDCGKKILITHYPIDENGNYKRHIKAPSAEECEELFDCYEADVYLFGHTHIRDVVNTENKLYINVGSLGCPMGEKIGHCGVLTVGNGKIDYEDVPIEYDIDKVISEIRKERYPMYETILNIFYTGNKEVE